MIFLNSKEGVIIGDPPLWKKIFADMTGRISKVYDDENPDHWIEILKDWDGTTWVLRDFYKS